MTEEMVIALGQEALLTILKVAAPVLGLSLTTGILVSIFQATTQIQEQTLAFVPKILAVLLGIGVFGSWMLTTLIDFTHRLYEMVPLLVR